MLLKQIMKRSLLFTLAVVLSLLNAAAHNADSTALRFEITVAAGLIDAPQHGRVFVVMTRNAGIEPRMMIGQTGMDAAPMFARDIKNFAPGVIATIDQASVAFPIENLPQLPAGDYFVQALFDSNIDLKSVNAPGNLYSKPRKLHLDPASGVAIKIELTERVAPEQLPAETDYVKFVRIQSNLLTKFHGRPIYLRAGVIIPRGFESDATKRF